MLPYLTPQEIAEIDRILVREPDAAWFEELIESFPKDHPHQDNLQARGELMRACSDKAFRNAELVRCEKDVGHWLSYWVWTYDPRLLPEPAIIPFVPWPRQQEYLKWRSQCIDNRKNGLIEKSRDSGLSWLNMAHQTHCWLFRPGWKGTIASRKEVYVDRLGDSDSLLEKVRIMLRYLPRWMKPSASEGFLKILNHETGAALTGETGYEIGRGGRSSAVDIDEAAFLERADRVDAAVSQNAQVVFWTSTPRGKANLFAQKRFSGKIDVFRFHWRDDPRKDEAWYEGEKARLEPVVLAQEIDIDYDASDPDSYILAKWVEAANWLPAPDSDLPKVAGLDIGLSGDRTVLIVRQGAKVLHCESWRGLDTTQTAFKAVEILKGWDCEHLVFDADGIGSGVAGTLAAMERLDLSYYPQHGNSAPSDMWWPGEEITSYQKFVNRRAELWGIVRDRCQKAHKLAEGLQEIDPSEAISFPPGLPCLLDIQSQLSTVKAKTTIKGKFQLESKAEMARRGIDSPDYADALCYSFAVSPNPGIEPELLGIRLSVQTARRYWR